MTTKILIWGEGPTDYGKPNFVTGQEVCNEEEWTEGAIPPIIRKSLERENLELYYTNIKKSEIKRTRIQRAKVKGHGKKAYVLSLKAHQNSIDNVVCYIDLDNSKGKKEHQVRKEWERKIDEINNGFQAYRKRSRNDIIGVPIVASRMIESWLLSDKRAFEKYFRTSLRFNMPTQPELIWGDKHDSDSDYPKNVFDKAVNACGCSEIGQDVYYGIANEIDINELINKCPISFEPFYNEIQNVR